MIRLRHLTTLSLVLFLGASVAFSQTTNDINKVPELRKGKILLMNGHEMEFRNLHVNNGLVLFESPQYGVQSYQADNISEIMTSRRSLPEGFLVGAGFGLVIGFMTPLINDEVSYSEDMDIILLTTAITTGVFALTGAITGLFVHKYKNVYQNSNQVMIYPQFQFDNNNDLVAGVTVSIALGKMNSKERIVSSY